MSMYYAMCEDAHARLERAHAALEFVADVVGDVELLHELLAKAKGSAPERTRHAEVHAGGIANVCHLISDELRTVLQAARFAVAEEQDDE